MKYVTRIRITLIRKEQQVTLSHGLWFSFSSGGVGTDKSARCGRGTSFSISASSACFSSAAPPAAASGSTSSRVSPAAPSSAPAPAWTTAPAFSSPSLPSSLPLPSSPSLPSPPPAMRDASPVTDPFTRDKPPKMEPDTASRFSWTCALLFAAFISPPSPARLARPVASRRPMVRAPSPAAAVNVLPDLSIGNSGCAYCDVSLACSLATFSIVSSSFRSSSVCARSATTPSSMLLSVPCLSCASSCSSRVTCCAS
mmetsp:Transcript_186/g.537  ORF Transcript_186/g.537 Transcript_186/m.537 type:complete len:255 (-) Transcript_186:414-1178(-)